ncbi:MFS transporter [Mycobacteroides chelonae]
MTSRLLAPWQRVALAMFGIAWGGNEFTPLLVMYRQAGQSAASVDTLLFAYVLGIIPALFLGGPLSDRYGRRAVMLPAPFISMAGSLVLALGAQHFALLFTGRVFSGIALGLAMAAGSSWVKELSAPPFDRIGAGARRGAMSLTAGFALGAAVAGALAQWGPWPQHLAFLVNIAITIPGAVLALSVPESAAERAPGRLVDDLKIPAARRRRFLFVVMPLAPWVFGSAAVAYAVLPTLIAPTLPGERIAFSALCCLVCLGCGFTAQLLAPRIDRPGTARLGIIGLALVAAGMALAAVAAHRLTIPWVLIAALVLGAGYGTALVSGLQEVNRIAGPTDLAGLTAVFYGLTYLGFGVPMMLTMLSDTLPVLTHPVLLCGGAILAALCMVVLAMNSRTDIREEAPLETAESGMTPEPALR